MGGSTNKYYLKVDDTVVDFSGVPGLTNMEDFLNLSIFTGLFNNVDELLKTLYNMGLIPAEEAYEVRIVKKKGNVKKGYSYSLVTEDLLFKRGASFLSTGCLKEFMYKNRRNYEAIVDLLESYRAQEERLISIFEIKIRRLEEDAISAEGKVEKALTDEIRSKKNSLSNFYKGYTNISEMLSLVAGLSNNRGFFDRESELEYLDRLDDFVDEEVYYFRGTNKTPNNRGLVKLAANVGRIIEKFEDIEIPFTTQKYREKKSMYLSAIKSILENPVKRGYQEPEVADTPIAYPDDDVDPDHYMFLEPEDFYDLIDGAEVSQEFLDSIEDSVLDLEAKKDRFKK